MSFALSIAALSLIQAGLVWLPGRQAAPPGLASSRSRWLAIVPAASIALVIGAVSADRLSADLLTYLALVAVPPLAAIALAMICRGARPPLALAVVPLFAVSWAASGTLAGEASALALSGLACVTLGSWLVALVPSRWLKLGIYAMAAIDAALVIADLLQGPNSVLAAATPGAGLPRLQSPIFGSAMFGFGDLFIAATLGALLVRDGRPQLAAAALAAAIALAFDLLFFWVSELPATVPIAVTLALLELRERRQAGPRSRTSRNSTAASWTIARKKGERPYGQRAA